MIYLKYFESNNNIDSICHKYGIKKYTINKDGSIDVDGDVNLNFRNLSTIPIKFGRVTSNFNCSNNNLTSLENCPIHVGGYFNCSNNKLTSLSGSPIHIGNHFECGNNQLTSLEGGPINIGGDYYCDCNKLISLKGAPKIVKVFECGNNQLETLEYMPILINGYLDCSNNYLRNLSSLRSDIKGNIYLEDNPLPKEILNNKNIKQIIKWQNDYSIWNKDGSLNKNNFQELINDL